jgi:putative ABC transport system permease protein
MTGWLLARSLRHAPRRALLAAVGIAFPVAIMAATLFFTDSAARQMTRIALRPVQIEMRALATTLETNMTQVDRELASVPGVVRVERFAATNVVVTGAHGKETARLFAVDPEYLVHHPWVRPTGSLADGALLNLQLEAAPSLISSPRVSLSLPGRAEQLATVPVGGTADLREASTWFEVPTGEVQGDIAMVPRALVIDYATFERTVLPAVRRELGTQTTVLNPGLSELPPVTVEAHITTNRAAYPGDPGRASAFSSTLRRVLERRVASSVVVADDTAEPLAAASTDADNAKILFLLLGIPGVLAAAALGLATESALAEAQRREEALLRLRGATDLQLVRLASAYAAATALAGALVGIVVAALAVSLIEGHALWRGVSAGRLVVSCLLAIAIGVAVTVVRVVRLRRAGLRSEVATERRFVQVGWKPPWQRSRLDLVMLAVGSAILVANAISGGLKPSQSSEAGANVALSFYVLLAPVALWLGLTLLGVRLALGALARRTAPKESGALPSWGAAVGRWLGRRPGRMAAALTLGVLAVAFGTEVVSFVGTYRSAKRADAHAAFGSQLRLRPTTEGLYVLPKQLPGVAATTPIRYVPVRAGTDRKTILTIDPSSYRQAATAEPQMIEGRGFDALRRDPSAVIVNKDVSQLLALRVGDTLSATVFPDDQEKSRHKDFRVVGIYRSFPPNWPPAELVTSTQALPPFLLPQPDFHLARVQPGLRPEAVAATLRQGGLERAFKVSTEAQQGAFTEQSIASLDLGPLSDIESVGAGLIAALGIAVLGAFLVLERRREYAILGAVGADGRQLLASPAAEGGITIAASLLIGVPLGLVLSIISVRVLGIFFVLPPPLVTVPVGTVLVFVAVMLAASAAVMAVALRAVLRVSVATTLREQ